jgi:ComF family protein
VNLRAAADVLLSLILAPPCAVCGRVLERPLAGAVCASCWAATAPRPSSFSLHSITRACAAGVYEGTLRDVIHALKYDGRRSIAPGLARLMVDHGADVIDGADIAVPVPLHRRRQRQRGFNQAEDLARGLRLPVVRALRRIRATPPQVNLPADQRRQNMRDAFALDPRVITARPLGEAVVVLVDDVATTGATLEACARVLKRGGAKEVRALTAARVSTAR